MLLFGMALGHIAPPRSPGPGADTGAGPHPSVSPGGPAPRGLSARGLAGAKRTPVLGGWGPRAFSYTGHRGLGSLQSRPGTKV